MNRRRLLGLAAVASIAAVVSSGCGLGPGESSPGEATLTVTRDYGAERLLEAKVEEPPESQTVIRMLDQHAEITTRYGGGFVHSINGIAGEVVNGRSLDWFFYVNGIESSRGGAEVQVRGGDRIWWDYRDWTSSLRAPLVVGSWPEPFAQVSAATERIPVRVECAGERGPCDRVAERLGEAGVDASVEELGAGKGATEEKGDQPVEAMQLLVGTWAEIRTHEVAAVLDRGPGASGVYARFEPAGERSFELSALDREAREVARMSAAGLVAGVGDGADADEPTWLVTGTDAAGLEHAVELLDSEHLVDRYAVAASPDGEFGLPYEEAE